MLRQALLLNGPFWQQSMIVESKENAASKSGSQYSDRFTNVK